MAADLDFVKVVGRFGLVVADGADPDTDPEIVWCDSGTVTFTPVNTYEKVSGASPIGFNSGQAVFEATLDSSGYITRSAVRWISLVDLTSDKVNPSVDPGKSTHLVAFNVKAGTTSVKFQSQNIRAAADTATAVDTPELATALGLSLGTMVCDLVKLLPVPTGSGTPIIVGPPGVGVVGMDVDGNKLVYTLTDGSTGETSDLPAAMVDSDAFIADRINTPESETNAALAAAIGAGVFTVRRQAAAFVTLGDSRMAYNGPVTVANGGETAVYTSDRGFVAQALVLARHRLKWLKNGGVGGDTVAQMKARLAGLLALNPSFLIGFGHVNSVTAGTSAAAIIADLGDIFDTCAAQGVTVVWGTDWVGTSTTTAGRLVSYTVNDWLRNQVGTRPAFYLADYQAVMVDVATGNPLATHASDGLHQDGIGPRALAGQLLPILQMLAPRSDRLIASNDDPINLCPNGMLTGMSGGGFASGWGTNGTAAQITAKSKVARMDGFPGEWQQLTFTAATDVEFRQRIAAGTANSWTAGQTAYGECEFETDAAGWDISQMNLNVALFGLPGGTVIRSADLLHVNTAPATASRLESGILRTPPILIPVGCTTLDLAFVLRGTGTVRLGRMALKQV